MLDTVSDKPHVHTDLDSLAMVDGTYLAAADIYVGDTSSQVVEFLARPRPCVFLNPQRLDWQATDDHEFWTCGEVVEDLSRLGAALEAAHARHADYAGIQTAFAEASLGDIPTAPDNAARIILQALDG